jgi:hypothetical protein
VPLVLLERSQGARFNGIYFERYWFRMGEILHFKWLFIENSNKSQKTKFQKEKSIENVITFDGLPFNSSMKNWDASLVLFNEQNLIKYPMNKI